MTTPGKTLSVTMITTISRDDALLLEHAVYDEPTYEAAEKKTRDYVREHLLNDQDIAGEAPLDLPGADLPGQA